MRWGGRLAWQAPLIGVLAVTAVMALGGAGTLHAQAGTPLRRVNWRAALSADPTLTVENDSVCSPPPGAGAAICVDVPLDVPQVYGGPEQGIADVVGYVVPSEITYADLDGDGVAEAVLPINSGGTAGVIGFLVYHEAPGTPLLEVIYTGYHLGVAVPGGRLQVEQPVYFGFEPNCCPTALWRTVYVLGADDTLQSDADPVLFLVLPGGRQETSPGAATVSAYYSAIGAGAYDFAYALLSPAAQRRMPRDSWQAGFANTVSVNAQVTPITATHVGVTITVTNATSAGGSSPQRFSGTWVLIPAESAPLGYLLDTATIQQQ
jgi:hypothetical protein